jgi:hypothetical protein
MLGKYPVRRHYWLDENKVYVLELDHLEQLVGGNPFLAIAVLKVIGSRSLNALPLLI